MASFIIPLIIYLASLVLFFIAGFKDPGIMKRNENNYGCHEAIIKVVHKGVYKKTRLCITCKIAKPFRSAHCADCDNCVMRFDHHCPWLGNCVAKRNYIFFYFFLLCLNLSLFLVGGFAITHIAVFFIENDNDVNNNVAFKLCDCVVSLFVIIFILLEMLFVTGLLFYHTYLVVTNMTTKEELKKLLHSKIGNYYNRGVGYNCKRFINRNLPYLNTLKQLNKEVPVTEKVVEVQPYIKGNDGDINSLTNLSNLSNEGYDKRMCNTSYKKDINSKGKIETGGLMGNQYHYYQTSIPNNSGHTHTETLDKRSEMIELKDLSSHLSIPQENSEVGQCDI